MKKINMIEKESPMCCYIGRECSGKPHGDNGLAECAKRADVEIINETPGAEPYDITESCLDHVGLLLGSASTDRVGHTLPAHTWTVRLLNPEKSPIRPF
jgi:hypothetical protein